MQDGVLNLARVNCEQRVSRTAVTDTACTARGSRFDRRCRAPATTPAAASPAILKCKGWSRSRRLHLLITRRRCGAICNLIGKPEWKTDPDYAKPPAPCRAQAHLAHRRRTMTKTKFEVMDLCNAVDSRLPDPVDQGIAEEKSRRDTGTVVESIIDPRQVPNRRNPVKSRTRYRREALAAARDHTEEILTRFWATRRRAPEIKTPCDHGAGEAGESEAA